MARSVVLHTGGSLVLAVGLCALLMLADAAGMLPRQFAAPAARSARFGAQPNPPQPNATLSLVSPSSGQGPVGATLTVSGSTWTASQVAIGAAASSANCANPTAGSATGWVATFNTTSVSNGSFTFSFTWPASLSAGNPYSLCAVAAPGGQPASSGGVAATSIPGTYTVRSSQPPTLSLSSSTVQVGQPYTITGTSFYGVSSVNISINNAFNQSAHPDGNGSFVVSVTPTADQAGNANIVAQSPPEGNAKPVLTATAQITVQGAPTVTPDPSPSPSPSPSPTIDATGTAAANSGGSPGGTTSTTGGGGGGGLIIVLIIAILLLLALIGGAITFLVLRRRGGGGPAFPGGPAGPGGPGSGGDWGGYPGHGTGPVPQYGQSATGLYGAAGSYGPTGFYPQPDPYAGQQAGGVASWDDAPPMGGVSGWDDSGGSAPGPDWQPRPMSGSQRRYDDPSYPPYAAPGQAPADPYGGAPTSGGYAPPDPWANTGGSYDSPPRGYAPPGRGGTGYPPRPARPQPPDAPWNSGENQDDNWNPGGSTNPTNQGW